MTMPGFPKPQPMDTPLNAGTGLLDHASANLLTAFSGCPLVPVPAGGIPNEAPAPLATEIQTAAFRSRLATQNITVLLGQVDGLFAVEFEDEAVLEAFLERNPTSRWTLITTHDGRPVLWHRAKTAHRVSLLLPGLNVLMRGNLLILNRDGLERTDLILNPAPPRLVNPETVDWGTDADGLIDSWLARLSHGEFFRRNTQGRAIPNRRSWRYYLTRRLRARVAYSAADGAFFELTATGNWLPVPDDQLRPRLRELIAISPVDAPEAKARLSDEWLDQVSRRLKTSLATHLPVAEARLRAFADRFLIKATRANVTNAELVAAFEAHCRETGQPRLSANKAKVMLGRILRSEPWLVGYSKSIQRPGGAQNGWRGVRLNEAILTQATFGGADGV